MDEPNLDRRTFIKLASGGLAAAMASHALGAGPEVEANRVGLPPIESPETEPRQPTPGPSAPPDDRVGFAVVGLGHLALGQVLPAFGMSKFAKPVALVSGHRDKALKIARQHGIREEAIYDYESYDRLAENPAVQVIYIILPNGMHAEYAVRGARAGKHILCEKPMATTPAECQQMIEACRTAKVKLMIGYRSQYEPLDRALAKLVREKKLGDLREFVSTNSQNQDDPTQWRLNRRMAGGGPLPDVGIYCINAARFLSGEEPFEVIGQTVQLPGDRRFREVEASVQFLLKFPSGLTAACTASYASHRSQFLRLQGSQGWAELNPAFAYEQLQMRHGQMAEGHDTVTQVELEPKNQFALELDHMAECVRHDRRPRTPGEEGLQDLRIVTAIYESARTGLAVRLPAPPGTTRGPDLPEEA